MKPILLIACVLALVATTFLVVNADVPKPKPSPKETRNYLYSSLEVIPDPTEKDAVLQIRQSDLKELRAALDGVEGSTTIAAAITNSGPRTIIAGLLLCLSLSIGGVWLVRSMRSPSTLSRGQKAVAILLVATATIGVAAIITRANAGPPPSYRWRNLPTALASGKAHQGPIIIQVVPDDAISGGLKLILPMKKQNANGEE